MKLIPQKVINMMLFLYVFTILFSCSKDNDLLLESVLNDPEISLEEKERPAEEESEDGLVTRTFSFSPTNDAYLQNEQGHDQSIIRLQEDYRTSYLMFDLSDVNGTITDAVLKFSIDSDEGDGSIAIHKGLSTDWTEENLTINNAPSPEIQLGSINKTYKVGAIEKVALNTDNLNAETTTLVMTHSTGNDLAFASKEHPANKGPKLVITYEAPEGSPLIEQQEEEDITEEEDNTQQEDTTEDDGSTQEEEQPNNNTASTEGAYYVTTTGSSSNNGLSEATAWSIEYAFDRAVAGDVVYIKAGDYGKREIITGNSGNSENPIKFIGYQNSPGDVQSNNGSTFNYGESANANSMPLLNSSNASDVAITIHHKYVHLENIQIKGYSSSIQTISNATNIVIRNIISLNTGNQTNSDAYDGFGISVRGNNSLVENCFVLNPVAQGITLLDSDYSEIKYCSVYANNATNSTDYYILLAGGTNNTLVENCLVQRANNLSHNGHGFNIKNEGSYNTFKNCTAVRTSFELTYSGVHHNVIDGGVLKGVDTSSANWHARLAIFGGAHHNTIKNILIEDTWAAIALATFNDRTGLDASLGNDNVFDNITVNNTNRVLNVGGGTNYNAKAKRYEFKNSNFSNFNGVATVYYGGEDFEFRNCTFQNGNRLVSEADGVYAPYSDFDSSWINCTWQNVDFTPPN